jgi:NTE family protein
MPDNTNTSQETRIENFVDDPSVKKMKDDLKSRFPNGIKMSDLVDTNNNQYVNLVQEGGGVLGIALVGFTYILETMGIRFWRLAGTSAGAINTILLAALKNKQDPKSEEILTHLTKDKDQLIKFVDGYSILKPLLMLILNKPSVIRKILWFLIGLLIFWLAALIVQAFIPREYILNFVIIVGTFYAILIGYIVYLLKRFKRHNFGLNPGNIFTEWISKILKENDADTFGKLKAKSYLEADQLLNVTSDRVQSHAPNSNLDKLSGSDVVLVACDITTEMKVEFPKNARLYWEDIESVNPAEFVRASMSIPFFFEAKCSPPINAKNAETLAEWRKINYTGKLPPNALFVDGGIISNFPINVFHNPNIKVPRLPTIGVRLGSGVSSYNKNIFKGVPTFIEAIFSTVRFHFDKDFLIKNNFYDKYVARIDVANFNWLNFGLTEKAKIDLFVKGAEAAYDFILKFDWQKYKAERAKLYEELYPERGI